jgi:hypothetical protein
VYGGGAAAGVAGGIGAAGAGVDGVVAIGVDGAAGLDTGVDEEEGAAPGMNVPPSNF